MAAVELQQMVLLVEADAEGEGAEDPARSFETGPVEGCHEGAELWQGRRRRQPDVGLVRVFVGADFVAFLKAPNVSCISKPVRRPAERITSSQKIQK